jgi:hypothetical protein
MLSSGVSVALVTAAGYGLNAAKYENRIRNLLEAFTAQGLTAEAKQRFYVIGGECNYLLQVRANIHLKFHKWQCSHFVHVVHQAAETDFNIPRCIMRMVFGWLNIPQCIMRTVFCWLNIQDGSSSRCDQLTWWLMVV